MASYWLPGPTPEVLTCHLVAVGQNPPSSHRLEPARIPRAGQRFLTAPFLIYRTPQAGYLPLIAF